MKSPNAVRRWRANRKVNRQPLRQAHTLARRVAPLSDNFGQGTGRRVPVLPANDAGFSLAYKAISDIFACVNVRAESVAKLKIKVVRAGTENEVEDTAWHTAVDFAMSEFEQDLVYLMEYALSIWGESYVLKLMQDDERTPGGLQWLNPQAVELVIEEGFLRGFEYTGSDGDMRTFFRKQVGYFHYRDSDDDNAGLSPMRSALDAANIKRNLQAFIEAFFANDATVGGIITGRSRSQAFGGSFTPLSDKNIKEIIETWSQQNAGARKAFKTVMLPWDLEYTRVGGEPPTSQIELTDDQRRNIHQSYRVPMSMTQAIDASDPLSSGSTISKDEAKFWSGWAIPEHKTLLLFINARIMPWLAPGLTLVGDYSDVLGLISDTAERRDMLRADVMAGLMPVNQYRKETNQKPLDNGDVLYVPTGVIVTPIDQLGVMTVEAQVIEEVDPETTLPEGDVTPLLPAPPVIPSEPNEARQLALSEYAAWHKFFKKRTKKDRFRMFNHKYIPKQWADETQKLLLESDFQLDTIDRIFAEAIAFHKTAQSRLLAFQDGFEAWMNSVAAGDLTGGRATNALNNMWNVQGKLMFSEGLVEGGRMDGIPDADEKAKQQRLITQQRPFARRLRAELTAGNISKDERARRLRTWGRQFQVFFEEGLSSANRNQMLECVGEDGKNSCRTCRKIKGQIHTAKVWERRKLRPGIDHDNFECGTWDPCRHILVVVTAGSKGTLPTQAQVSAWAAKASEHTHDNLPPLDQQPYTMAQYDRYYETNGYEVEQHHELTITNI